MVGAPLRPAWFALVVDGKLTPYSMGMNPALSNGCTVVVYSGDGTPGGPGYPPSSDHTSGRSMGLWHREDVALPAGPNETRSIDVKGIEADASPSQLWPSPAKTCDSLADLSVLTSLT